MVRTKIHELVIAGDDEELQEYFADAEHTLQINEPDAIGWTPLHWACSKGDNAVVRILLEKDANPNAATKTDGWTPAHDAARNGKLDCLQQLNRAGANIERASSSGTRPLHYAVQYGQSKAVDWMLMEGCDVDGANSTGWSPLHFATRYGRKEVVNLLLARGACPSLVDKTGRSCEDLAVWVRDSIKEGKAKELKLDETVKAETLEEMMVVIKAAAEIQAAESAKTAKLAMDNYVSSYESGDLHGASEHLFLARDMYKKARDADAAKDCDVKFADLQKEIKAAAVANTKNKN